MPILGGGRSSSLEYDRTPERGVLKLGDGLRIPGVGVDISSWSSCDESHSVGMLYGELVRPITVSPIIVSLSIKSLCLFTGLCLRGGSFGVIRGLLLRTTLSSRIESLRNDSGVLTGVSCFIRWLLMLLVLAIGVMTLRRRESPAPFTMTTTSS